MINWEGNTGDDAKVFNILLADGWHYVEGFTINYEGVYSCNEHREDAATCRLIGEMRDVLAIRRQVEDWERMTARRTNPGG